MTRSSPGVRRVASILNFIADHPGQAFTLTDLVKALKLSRATCHALLTGLVEVGYLYRASDKNYILGPTLASIGRVAAQHASPLQVAQPEMRAMADRFDLLCCAFFRERDEIVLRDRALSVSHVGWSVAVGTKLRLTPSLGAPFYTWLPDTEVGSWLDGYRPEMTAEIRGSVLAGMKFLRDNGYQVHVQNPVEIDVDDADRTYLNVAPVFPTSQLAEIDDGASYLVGAIVSPVFEAGGQVAFTLALTGFNGLKLGADIRHIGEHLRDASGRITTFITGQPSRFAVSREA